MAAFSDPKRVRVVQFTRSVVHSALSGRVHGVGMSPGLTIQHERSPDGRRGSNIQPRTLPGIGLECYSQRTVPSNDEPTGNTRQSEPRTRLVQADRAKSERPAGDPGEGVGWPFDLW